MTGFGYARRASHACKCAGQSGAYTFFRLATRAYMHPDCSHVHKNTLWNNLHGLKSFHVKHTLLRARPLSHTTDHRVLFSRAGFMLNYITCWKTIHSVNQVIYLLFTIPDRSVMYKITQLSFGSSQFEQCSTGSYSVRPIALSEFDKNLVLHHL